VRRLALADEAALGDQRRADAPRLVRDDAGVAEVDLRALDRAARAREQRLVLLDRGDGVVVVLPADRVLLDQRRIALLARTGVREVGLGATSARASLSTVWYCVGSIV
jgi:hypothetical protein